MAQPTGPERARGGTEQEVRRVARELLVAHGREGVTLRAIARELGITAPALYRYYDSFEDLIRQVCADICTDLSEELVGGLACVPAADTAKQVFTVCRRFRTWALAHPREFTLVFATPVSLPDPAADEFGRIFLSLLGRLLATQEVPSPVAAEVPPALVDDLARFRASLRDTVADLPEHVFSPGAAYLMLRFWVRLYGQVALEVFGRFPFAVSAPEPLFESMLTELAAEVGLAV